MHPLRLRAFSNDSDEIFKNSILKQHNSSCFEKNYYPRTRTNSGHLEDKGVEISSRADENSEIFVSSVISLIRNSDPKLILKYHRMLKRKGKYTIPQIDQIIEEAERSPQKE